MELSFNTDSGLVTATAKQYISAKYGKIMRNNTIYIYYMPDNPKELLPTPWEMSDGSLYIVRNQDVFLPKIMNCEA